MRFVRWRSYYTLIGTQLVLKNLIFNGDFLYKPVFNLGYVGTRYDHIFIENVWILTEGKLLLKSNIDLSRSRYSKVQKGQKN